MLVTRKTLDRLGSSTNESAGSKVSAFAMKQMEKMGWDEGKGLGKREDGIQKHITVKKKDESSGLGLEQAKLDEKSQNENWWHVRLLSASH